MCLDDRVILWEPQPSHLVSNAPREWPLVSLIPFLDLLLENPGGEIGVECFIGIDPPRISEKYVVSQVLAD